MSEMHKFSEDDAEIGAAIEEAQRRYPEFIDAMIMDAVMPRPSIKGATVKAKFQSAVTGSTEHMWVKDVQIDRGDVVGVLANVPEEIPEVSEGDQVRIPQERISDWLYWRDDESAVGGFVLRVMQQRGLPW